MEPVNQPISSPSRINVVERAKNMIIQPAREWNVVAAEVPNPNQIIMNYVLILAGAAAIAAFIGYAFVGDSFRGIGGTGIRWGLYHALSVLLGALISVYLVAFVVDALAPSFGSEKNFNRSLQLVAYSYTPAWIGGLLAIIPTLSLIGGLFGLYGLYLMYLGLPKIKKTPDDKTVGYLVVTILVTLVVYFVVGWILGTILMSIFGISYGNYQLY